MWDDKIIKVQELREQHRSGGGPERIRRQHESGKLTAYERISLLLDEGIEYSYQKTREKRLMSFQFCDDGDDGDGEPDSCA